MHQYLESLRRIMTTGVDKADRTDTGTRSVFGNEMRFKLQDGFPLVTTKKVNFDAVAKELLWFISGDTNNETLKAQGVNIWNSWAYPKTEPVCTPEEWRRGRLLDLNSSLTCQRTFKGEDWFEDQWENTYKRIEAIQDDTELHAEINKVIAPRENVQYPRVGELGPVYGAMWRTWPARDEEAIDQLANVIELLKTRPDSRRILVSAWNPELLPDEGASHAENVHAGKQVLPPCHLLFQFYTRLLSHKERGQAHSRREKGSLAYWKYVSDQLDELDAGKITDAEKEERCHAWLDERNVPTRALSCMLMQRSADFPVGIPYNIASYALLTHLMAQCVNMVADEFILYSADSHIYANQFEGVNEQLTREPLPLPTLVLNPAIKNIDDFTINDIKLENYQHLEFIKYPVAV